MAQKALLPNYMNFVLPVGLKDVYLISIDFFLIIDEAGVIYGQGCELLLQDRGVILFQSTFIGTCYSRFYLHGCGGCAVVLMELTIIL